MLLEERLFITLRKPEHSLGRNTDHKLDMQKKNIYLFIYFYTLELITNNELNILWQQWLKDK